MNIENIIKSFKEKVCAEISLVAEGNNRFRVFSPFMFDDRDQLAIILKRDNGLWKLTDEGHTLMHLSYDIDVKDLEKGTRYKILSDVLSSFEVADEDGELILTVKEDFFGDALFSYIQALIKITDISYLSREIVRSTFMEDFRKFVSSVVPENRLSFDYIEKKHDPNGIYPVDCRINNVKRPMFLFGIPNESKCKDVTINILQYERWNTPFYPVAIFENQEDINRKVLARFSDVAEKQFSNLFSNRDRIEKYLKEYS